MFSCVALLSLFIALSTAATIASLTPYRIPTTGGPLNGTGTSLNTPANAYISYTSGSTVEAPVSASGGSAFSIAVGPGTGATKPALIYFNNFADEFFYTDLYSYYAPAITSVSVIPNAGGAITIIGTNFGNSAGLISVAFTSYAGQVFTCSSIVVTTHTQITCNLDYGVGNGTIRVTVDGQVSSAYYAYYNDFCGAVLSTLNRISNPKFEDTSAWTVTGSATYVSSANSLGCGAYSLRVPDSGEVTQTVTLKASGRLNLFGFIRLATATSFAPTVNVLGLTDCTWTNPFDTNGLYMMVRMSCTGAPWASATLSIRTSASNSVLTHFDDFLLCYPGDSGCFYEIYSNGMFFPPFVPTNPDASVFVPWVYQAKKGFKLVENAKTFGITAPLATIPAGAYTTFYMLVAASSNSVSINFYTPDLVSKSLSTSWQTISFSLPNANINTISFTITTGSTIYVAAMYVG